MVACAYAAGHIGSYGDFNQWNNHHVMRMIQIPAVCWSRVCVMLSVLVWRHGEGMSVYATLYVHVMLLSS